MLKRWKRALVPLILSASMLALDCFMYMPPPPIP